jgi:hypothetical protein
MRAEGWYLDPYKLHTDRWFSDGHPTALVRDDGVESRDPPPPEAFQEPLVRTPENQRGNASDLRRADEAEAGGPIGAGRQIWAGIETAATAGLGEGDPYPYPESERD